jgi:cytochrome c
MEDGFDMKFLKCTGAVGGLALSLAGLLASPAALAVDADAAQALARQNNCFKCHSVEKKKDGPSFKETAAKYKGKPEAQDRIVKHLTSGEKAKFPDGHEEDHKIIKAKDPAEIKNLADWILAQ